MTKIHTTHTGKTLYVIVFVANTVSHTDLDCCLGCSFPTMYQEYTIFDDTHKHGSIP